MDNKCVELLASRSSREHFCGPGLWAGRDPIGAELADLMALAVGAGVTAKILRRQPTGERRQLLAPRRSPQRHGQAAAMLRLGHSALPNGRNVSRFACRRGELTYRRS